MADETTTNQAHIRLLRYFAFQHLPADLQQISTPVGELARAMIALLHDAPDPAEVTVGLRKLLEAKDCFVRARLPLVAGEGEA